MGKLRGNRRAFALYLAFGYRMTTAASHHSLLFRHTDWLPPLLIIVLLAASWVTVISRAGDDDARAVRDAEVIQTNVAEVVVNHTEQLIGWVRVLNGIMASSRDSETARDMVNSVLGHNGAFLRLMQFDGAGRLQQSIGKSPEAWLRQAATRFSVSAHGDSAERIVVETAAAGDDANAWVLPVFYRPSSAHEGEQSFIAVLIDKGQFQQQFGNILLGKGAEILLLSAEGQELLRLRDGQLESTHGRAVYRRLPEKEGTSVDQNDRIVVFRSVPRSGISVIVSRTRDQILMENRARQRTYMGSALLLSLTMLVLTALWIMAAGRRRKLIHSLTVAQLNNERLIEQIGKEKEAAYLLATHDKLTGLPNRMLFADLARRHVARAQRLHGGFALIFIDLDRFKPINDTFGHKAGDQLLMEVAYRLLDCVRQTDVVSRLGGDEFVALVGDLRNNQDVSAIAEKFIDVLSRPYTGIVADTELRVTPSIGIAFYPDDADDIDALLRQADMAMYRAKERGRATYAFADPALNRRYELSNQIEAALPHAIKHGDIRVHYQPKVSLTDFRITGLEALARWEHAQMGHVSPADFVPVAEKCGAIYDLGDFVLREVCRQQREWLNAGLPVVPIAVNVSPRQIGVAKFYQRVEEILAEREIAPALIEMEITETGLIETEGGFVETLNGLAALGIVIAIDDFGTGYSGFSHLRNLPAKHLKIDRSFVKGIRNDVSDAAIVSTTISLAHKLHLETIAEGVETQEQLAHLKAARCDQAQGYLFSPPCAPAEIARLLTRGHIHVDLSGGNSR